VKPSRYDLLIAGGVTAFGVSEMLTAEAVRGPRAANVAFVVVVGVLLALRRRWPLGAGAAALAAIGVMAWPLSRPTELTWFFLPPMVVAYTFGAHLDRRRALMGFVILIGAVTTVNLAMGTPTDLFPLVFMSLALLAGRAARSRSELAAELHEAAVLAEEAREREAGEAVAEERRRIAREMHDVVAHSMSVMVVQAGGARRILDLDPARAEAAAEQIERTGREALDEMRRLLGVLRPGDGRRPQPGLEGLDALVERARAAGLAVSLEVAGERPALPAGLELAAYRILQEALTNAIKHAATASTRVRVRYEAERLELLVENGAAPRAPRANGNGAGSGHGLVGMRERVRMFDGELVAGELPGGGFRVRASLPVPADA
jgi:signal transduction histidine kinase